MTKNQPKYGRLRHQHRRVGTGIHGYKYLEAPLNERESFVNEVTAIFNEADEDDSGSLTWEEFSQNMTVSILYP